MRRGGTHDQGKIRLLCGSLRMMPREDKLHHQKTQELLEYWDSLRQDGAVPKRQEIQPQHIKKLLPNIFMLEQFDDDHMVFRLAGTRLCERY